MDNNSKSNTGHWGRVPGAASPDRRLSAGDWRVLVLLSVYADKNGRCFPSQALMANHLGVRRQVVGNHLRRLEGYGYLRRELRHRNTRGAWPKTYYTILYPILRKPYAA